MGAFAFTGAAGEAQAARTIDSTAINQTHFHICLDISHSLMKFDRFFDQTKEDVGLFVMWHSPFLF
jgi:hypothetical protein